MAWADVTSTPHTRGPRGTAWFVEEAEIGHIHGNGFVDIALPQQQVDEIVSAGRARPHHMFPELGITVDLNSQEDVERAIELLRLSYDLIRQKQQPDSVER